MPYPFAEIAFTEAVRARQSDLGSREHYARFMAQDDPRGTEIGAAEAAFLAERDSFYMATVNSDGWPYIQHRGGPKGFVRVLSPTRIGFADFAGNRQYISLGNLDGEDRIALFFMDYPNRRRLKAFGRARAVAPDDPILESLVTPGYRARIERGMVIDLDGLDWNCPQHIMPRFTPADVEAAQGKLLARIADLEQQVSALKGAQNQAPD